MTPIARHQHCLPRRQRGVVLFVALIAMVILSLAGVALMRSVQTSTGVAGNLAFRQASIAPVNQAIEETIKIIFKAKTLGATSVDHVGKNYYASLQPNESKNGVPEALAGNYASMLAVYNGKGLPAPFLDNISGTELRWVIERVCNMDGLGAPATTQQEIIGHCDILPPKVPNAGTDNKVKPIPLPPIPIYRVTVRADIANTNAVSYAQAFLR
ncbi:MAG: hypothetical protein ABI831_21330 [Betaproteobacteria bacterium]